MLRSEQVQRFNGGFAPNFLLFFFCNERAACGALFFLFLRTLFQCIMNGMKLGTKINIVLTAVVAVVLTAAFWILINIEGKDLKQQVMSDATTTTDILRMDIERMFNQVHNQRASLQETVDRISKTPGVKYVNINDAESKYTTTTDHALIGQKIKEADLAVLADIKKKRAVINVKKYEDGAYELERFIPIFINANDPKSSIINVIEVEVVTRSTSEADIREAEKLLQVITASVEQNARAIILTYSEDLASLQEITDNITKFHFFHDFIIYDDKLNIIANTGGEAGEFAEDPMEYKQLREDTLSGKLPIGEVDRLHEGHPIIMRVVPITSLDKETGTTRNIGLIEIHILKESYETRLNELKLRMFGVGIIFTVILVTVLAVFLRKEIIGPITRYSKIAQKVSEGDLNQVIKHTSDDEIGRFGDVFNSMVTNLREFDRLKSDFISVAAHQLRTPLSGVKWVLKLLLDGDLGAISLEQKEMLKRGFDTNEKMIQLVNDLLNVSRIENGKFGYDFKENDFTKLLAALVDNSDLVAKARRIEVLLEDRAHVGPFFFDAEKLLIALQNIVDNAIKYTLPGGRVMISIERQGDYVQVKIKDSGVGIPKDEIHKLFSKFFRATNVIHLQTDGSGLGLFIVKNIIMRHGGQIWVDSIEGKGTTFTIIIPLIIELLPKEEVEPTSGGVSAPASKTGTV